MKSGRLHDMLRMLKHDPKDPFMRYAVALEYVANRKYQLGVHYLQQIIKMDRHYVPAYHQLGLILAQMKKRDEAVAILQQGIKIAEEKGDQVERNEMEDLLHDLRRPRRLSLNDKMYF
jgi:tetratricopeptide (TPR) repeat protein